MASAAIASSSASSSALRSQMQHQQQQQLAGLHAHAPVAPPGTLGSGTQVQVGQYVVTIERFLSEGGFAHVYLVKSQAPIDGSMVHVLKRIAVPDKEALKGVRKEVDIMKQLRGHRHIVSFIEATASPLQHPTGAFEVFILMEYCPGGGIIDMMNTRLQNRLTESEILKIFSDTVEAVAHMHFQDPPLIHRDLKVENILLSSPSLYKLCDFGSTTVASTKPARTMAEIQALEADLNKSTTIQYRAPEMCDVWARKPVGTPADIWALGVLLYKLCYYTTPFEEHGPLAILNVQYKIPPYPAYSDQVKGLIASMLQESAGARPTVYQVYERVCKMRGTTPKFADKSTKLFDQAAPSPSMSPSLASIRSPPLASSSSPGPSKDLDSIITVGPQQPIRDPSAMLAESIAPMRRGRPTKGAQLPQSQAAPIAESSPRLLRTGLARVGSDGVDGSVANRGWDTSFASRDKNQGIGSAASFASWKEKSSSLAPANSTGGFGDSFAPPVSSNIMKSATGGASKSSNLSTAFPEKSATGSSSFAATTGPAAPRPELTSRPSGVLFDDLVPAKPQRPESRPMNSISQFSKPSTPSPAPAPPPKSNSAFPSLASFEDDFNRSNSSLGVAKPAPSPARAPTLKSSDTVGPSSVLNGGPLTSSKTAESRLGRVERSAQTSPKLLAEYIASLSVSQKPRPPSPNNLVDIGPSQGSSVSKPTVSSANAAASVKPIIDLLSGNAHALADTTTPLPTPSTVQPIIDLLSDNADVLGDVSFGERRGPGGTQLRMSKTGKDAYGERPSLPPKPSGVNKRLSLVGSGTGLDPARDRFKPSKRLDLVSADNEDEDDVSTRFPALDGGSSAAAPQVPPKPKPYLPPSAGAAAGSSATGRTTASAVPQADNSWSSDEDDGPEDVDGRPKYLANLRTGPDNVSNGNAVRGVGNGEPSRFPAASSAIPFSLRPPPAVRQQSELSSTSAVSSLYAPSAVRQSSEMSSTSSASIQHAMRRQPSEFSATDSASSVPLASRQLSDGATSSSEDGAEGNFDLNRALASIRKFAPEAIDVGTSSPRSQAYDGNIGFDRSAPPLHQPTPQSSKPRAAISNLVSRYESLSNEPSSPSAPAPAAQQASVQPSSRAPQVPVKPTALRGQPTSSSFNSSNRRASAAFDSAIQSRDLPERDASADVTSSPRIGSNREPFKPVRSSATDEQAQPLSARRLKFQQGVDNRQAPPGSPQKVRPPTPTSSPEERFEGVGKMKNKWDTMIAASNQTGRQNDKPGHLRRTSTVSGSSTGRR